MECTAESPLDYLSGSSHIFTGCKRLKTDIDYFSGATSALISSRSSNLVQKFRCLTNHALISSHSCDGSLNSICVRALVSFSSWRWLPASIPTSKNGGRVRRKWEEEKE